MIKVREYTERYGRARFQQSFEDLDVHAATKITVALSEVKQRNASNVQGLGSRVLELGIDNSPGYLV